MTLREELWSAKRKALEARQSRERAELDAQRLFERAEEAAHRERELHLEAERARKERARLAARLKTTEETLRHSEAEHVSIADAARRLAHIAAEAATKEARARRAEEDALAEAARIEEELRPADEEELRPADEEELPPADEVREERPPDPAMPVAQDEPPVVIPDVEETSDEPEPPAPADRATRTRREKRDRQWGPFLASLVLAGSALGVGAAWALVTRDAEPTGAEPEGAEPSVTSPAGAVVPDAEGLTALDARRRLAAAGLTLAEVVPIPGTPGQVVGSVPAAGRRVTPGTPVTLYVGVERDRYDREITSTSTPG
jgi:hypothetical protein